MANSHRLLEDGSDRLLEDGASVRLLEDVGVSPASPVGPNARLVGVLVSPGSLVGRLAT